MDVSFCLYVLRDWDDDTPEMLRQLRMAMVHQLPVIVWRRGGERDKPLPSLLADYEDVRVFDGSKAAIWDTLEAYLLSRDLVREDRPAQIEAALEAIQCDREGYDHGSS